MNLIKDGKQLGVLLNVFKLCINILVIFQKRIKKNPPHFQCTVGMAHGNAPFWNLHIPKHQQLALLMLHLTAKHS